MIHVLRISEEAEKKEEKRLQKATKSLSKPLSLPDDPKSVAFVENSGCELNKATPIVFNSIKLHKSAELGPDVHLMQGNNVLMLFS